MATTFGDWRLGDATVIGVGCALLVLFIPIVADGGAVIKLSTLCHSGCRSNAKGFEVLRVSRSVAMVWQIPAQETRHVFVGLCCLRGLREAIC